MRKSIAALAVMTVLSVTGCRNPGALLSVEPETDTGTSLNVLFIGSSYFTWNDLPVLFARLAGTAGDTVSVGTALLNGTYLSYHAASEETEAVIRRRKWDYVVLQGVGSKVAFERNTVLGALRTLAAKIRAASAETRIVFCLPWAFEDGMTWVEGRTETYFDMQDIILTNTLYLAEEVDCIIAPVGEAWRKVMEENPAPHYLFMADYNHPSLRGSYLTACVIYTTLCQKSARDIAYTAGLPAQEAGRFQDIATSVVLNSTGFWRIPRNP